VASLVSPLPNPLWLGVASARMPSIIRAMSAAGTLDLHKLFTNSTCRSVNGVFDVPPCALASECICSGFECAEVKEFEGSTDGMGSGGAAVMASGVSATDSPPGEDGFEPGVTRALGARAEGIGGCE